MKLNRFHTLLLLGWGVVVLAVFLATPMTALADDCLEDPLNGADCMRTPGFRWVLTAGISLAGTLSAIAANLANAANAAAASGQKLPVQEQLTYVLHLSTQTMKIKPGEGAPLIVTAYAVTAKGSRLAPEAGIQVAGNPGAGLNVAPSSGMGQVHCMVTAAAKAMAGAFTLQVSASAPKSAGLSATVSVEIEAPFTYELRAEPKELSLAPGEGGEVIFSVVHIAPDGTETADAESHIRLWPPSPKNPFKIDPLRGQGELACSITAEENASIDLYYLDGVASSPDKKVDMKARVKLRVTGRQVWLMEFRKYRWRQGNAGLPAGAPAVGEKINLREALPEANALLDELDENGGTLVVAPSGRLKHARGEIRSAVLIQDGECTIERGKKRISAHWDAGEQGYVFKIDPPGDDSGGSASGSGFKDTLAVPVIRLDEHHEQMLNNMLLRDAGKIEQSMNIKAWGMAEGFIQRYMDYVAQEPVSVLTERSTSLNIWLMNTVTFVGSTLEAAKAYQLTLELHSRGYKRFMDALINGIIEGMFAALDLTVDYLLKGKSFVKSAAENGSRETVQRIFADQGIALKQQADSLGLGLYNLRQQSDVANLQRYLGGKELAQAGAMEKGLIQAELDRLESSITSMTREVAELSEQMAVIAKKQDVLFDLQRQLSGAKNVEQFVKSLQNYTPAPGAQCKDLIQTVSDIASKRKVVLESLLNQPELAPKAPQIMRMVKELDDMVAKTGNSVATAKSSIGDLNIEQQLQEHARRVREKLEQAQKEAEAIGYESMDWQYYEGFDKVWWFVDKLVEFFHWANALLREWIPPIAWLEDKLVECVEGLVKHVLITPSQWVLDFTQRNQWLTSAIDPEVREVARSHTLGFGLSSEFYRFPAQTNAKLNDTIDPTNLARKLDGGSLPKNKAAALQTLKVGAEGGYSQERAAQLQRARQYFRTMLASALEQNRWREDPSEESRTRAREMPAKLRSLVQTMEEYIDALKSAEVTGTEGLTAIPERLFFGKEWTVQDLEVALEWAAWSVRWVITLASLLSISTGAGAPVGAGGLLVADRVEQVGALLRIAMHTLWIMPTVVGFQYDVICWHALLHAVIYEEQPVDAEGVLVERYTVSA